MRVWPLEIGLQDRVSNYAELLQLRVVVVSVGEKALIKCQVRVKKTNESEPLMTCRKAINRYQNQAALLAWDESRRHLLTDWMVPGMEVA